MDIDNTEAVTKPSAITSKFALFRLLSLHSDQASDDIIDTTLRDNARLAGTNLWVLMFAIAIAAVGLNVNSTAVIIGAMLISPLMGPIIGIGYGASIHDYALIRQSFRNLGIFIAISLFASTLYFLLTPLTQAHSELLARTSPTIWDVLIAVFGGAAGMIGLTRKEKTTLIPGVAIATALMPPLCTTGYGLATGQPRYFLGAFYLFLINAVFIAASTMAIARMLRLPHHTFPSETARRRSRIVITAAITLTLAPSIYLAYRLVQEELFTANAEQFLRENFSKRGDVTLLMREIDPRKRTIGVTLVGQGVTPNFERKLNSLLPAANLAEARLVVRHPSEERIDIAGLKRELHVDALHSTAMLGEANAHRIDQLEKRLAPASIDAELPRLAEEIRAQLPTLRNVFVTRFPPSGENDPVHTVLVAIDMPGKLPPAESGRLKRWLHARLPDRKVHLLVGQLFL